MGYGFSTGSGEESELRELESRVYALPVAALESRVAALENQAWLLWNSPPGAGCLITIMFQVRDSGGAWLSGVPVQVLDSGGFPVASGSTTPTGTFFATVFGVDAYTYSATHGSSTLTGSVGSVACGGAASVLITFASLAHVRLGGEVRLGGSTGFAGFTVQVIQGGTVYSTLTTTAGGGFGDTVSFPPGTLPTIVFTDPFGRTLSVPTTDSVLDPVNGNNTTFPPFLGSGASEYAIPNTVFAHDGGTIVGLVGGGASGNTVQWGGGSFSTFYTFGYTYSPTAAPTLSLNIGGASVGPSSLTFTTSSFSAAFNTGGRTITITN